MKAFKWMRKEQNSVRRISWLLIIMFIFSLITLRIIIARADNGNKKLNVLEIQPANSFTLKGVNNLTQTGIDTKAITRSSTLETYDVTIEHVSMPEFIGKIDQINGKYDVIVIGRNNANIAAPYRDYSAINNNGTEYTGSIGSGNELLPNGNYVENDITKRKAEEIKAFVNSGQLVYMNNSILTDVSKLQNSNLYKTFNPITARNLIKYDYVNNNEELSLENILEKYLEKDSSSQNDIINKRPIITVENTSGGDVQTDYSNTTQADYLGSTKKRNMKFLINIPQDADKFTVKMFLDINGDGVFTDDECYRKATNVSSQPAYSLSYNIGPQFIGWLDWKVEVEKPNGVKSYVVGNVFFKKLKEDDIKQVKVLQVSPSAGLDLQNDATFKSMLKSFNDKKDYNLNITKITSDEFNSTAGKSLKLNGTYDMIIIGFSDSYNKKDITGDALNELQTFIKSGQSVMFTHDTMTLRMESPGQASIDLTKRFRDFVGQSRFIDKYRTDGRQTDAYQQYDPETKTYVERIIPHSDLIDQNGSILTTNSSIVGYALNGRKNITHTTKVYKTNSGLISNYPFKLSDISVAQTHNQWYQLDLEDPDVVPWYNLKYDGITKSDYYNTATPSGSKLNQYDSRNNYYTYSKGNITYSGTGHSQGYTTEEFQLFINTMIKAERGANHKPDVVCSILNEYKEDDGRAVNEVPKGADYTFKVDANDLDKDKVNVDIKINGRALDSSNVTMSNLNNNGLFEVNTQNINRLPLTVTIPAQNLSTLGNDITVVIKATDIQGADSETKTYKIRPVEMPKFDINAGIPTLKKINSSGSMTQVSGTIATVKPGDEVLVSYNVTPSELKYGDTKAVGSKEISVIIDDSLTQSTWAQFKNGLDDTLGELLDTGYMRYNVITFGKDGASVYKEGSSVDDLKNNLTRENLGNDIGKTDLDGKKISSALDLSVEFFNDSEFQTDSASKTIMIFSKGNVEAINEQVKSLIKDNYNVITVQISDDNNSESPNLKNVHNALGALKSDYYVCNSGHGRESNDSVDVIMEEISNSISRIEYQTYMLDNVEVNFNLGDEIDLVSGLTQVDINTNEYKKTLPKVKYVVDVDDNGSIRTDNGKPIYKGYFIDTDQQDSTYTESYPVNFKITSAEGAHGLCTFSTPNEVTYKYFGTNLPGSTDISSTPQLQLDEVAVSHGVYKGVKNGQVEYLSGSNVNFVDDSVGTFAAQINNLYKDNTTLSLNIDANCEIVRIPTIYKITEGNNLVKLTDSSGNALVFTPSGNNNYVFNNFNGSVNNDIVVLYSVKFKGFNESPNEPKKEYMYTNKITADGYSASAKVPRKTDGKLQDLF